MHNCTERELEDSPGSDSGLFNVLHSKYNLRYLDSISSSRNYLAQGSRDWIQEQIETRDARILKMQHFELQTSKCFSIISMVLGCVIV